MLATGSDSTAWIHINYIIPIFQCQFCGFRHFYDIMCQAFAITLLRIKLDTQNCQIFNGAQKSRITYLFFPRTCDTSKVYPYAADRLCSQMKECEKVDFVKTLLGSLGFFCFTTHDYEGSKNSLILWTPLAINQGFWLVKHCSLLRFMMGCRWLP